MAALLACGGAALLSHETAGELHGFVDAGSPAADPRDRPLRLLGGANGRRQGTPLASLRAHRRPPRANHRAPAASTPVLDLVHCAPDRIRGGRSPDPPARARRRSPSRRPGARDRSCRRPARYRPRRSRTPIALLREGVLSALEHRYLVDVECSRTVFPRADARDRCWSTGSGATRTSPTTSPAAGRSCGSTASAATATRARRSSTVGARSPRLLARTPSVPFGWDRGHHVPVPHGAGGRDASCGLSGWDGLPRGVPAVPCVNFGPIAPKFAHVGRTPPPPRGGRRGASSREWDSGMRQLG